MTDTSLSARRSGQHPGETCAACAQWLAHEQSPRHCLSAPPPADRFVLRRPQPCGWTAPTRNWAPRYAGVKGSRSVVRSSAATVSRQTHGRRIPAGSGWAANDVSACW